MTTWYLLILLLLLSAFSILFYILLAQSVNINAPPANSYVIEVNASDPTALTQGKLNPDAYQLLYSYTVHNKDIPTILATPTSVIYLSSPAGQVPIDQKGFINSETQGDQEVWVYYRRATVDPTKLEVLVLFRSVSELHQELGQYGIILIYALPVSVILAGFVGFILLRRMLRPVEVITKSVRTITGEMPNSRTQIKGDEFAQLLGIGTRVQTFANVG